MAARQSDEARDVERALSDKEGWPEYRRLVLDKLDRLENKVDRIDGDLTGLKIKSAAWGVTGGILTAIITAALQYLSSRGH